MWESINDSLQGFWSDNAGALVGSLVVLVGAVVVRRLLRSAIGRWESRIDAQLNETDNGADRERAQRLATIADVMRIVLSLGLWTVVVLTIMGVWGIPMTPLVAVGTTVGVAVGFGAQDVVRDVIAGFLILVEDQYSIGDVVTVAGVSGAVEGIKLRTTVLRDLDGNRHYVPNGQIKVATNLTSEFSRLVVDISVAYDTDIERAIDVITDEATTLATTEEWQSRFLEPPKMLGVNRLGDSAIDIRVLMTLTTDARWEVKREFLRRIKARLDREGIEIPYQHVTLVPPRGSGVVDPGSDTDADPSGAGTVSSDL